MTGFLPNADSAHEEGGQADHQEGGTQYLRLELLVVPRAHHVRHYRRHDQGVGDGEKPLL